MKLFKYIVLICVQTNLVHAQVFVDFEDGNIQQWLVEADGVPSLSAAGNPGNCLRVDDEAVSQINEVVAPWAYTGNWSSAQSNDSIAFDLYAHESGTLLQNQYPLITLSGPGGTAITLIGAVPAFDTWQHIAIPLDSASWNVTGSWTELLAEIQVLKIRTEFVTGDEWTLLDNVRLTFSPAIEPLAGTICSTWDGAGVYDGWSFQNVGSIEVSMTQGFPPGSVRMGDGSGALTYAVAAPKFRGDWSALDGEANMTFDLFLQTSSSNYYAKEYLVMITGPGGSAQFMTNDSITALTANQWRSYEIPITENSWELITGTWTGLLDFVAEIRLDLEFINGTGETTYLDNFCLNAQENSNTVFESGSTSLIEVFPNPFNDHVTITGVDQEPVHMRLYDATGRHIMEKSIKLNCTLDLSKISNGSYTALFWKDLERIERVQLIKQ